MNLILSEAGGLRARFEQFLPPVGGPLARRVARYQRAKLRSEQMLAYIWGLLQTTPEGHPQHWYRLRQVQRLRACGTWLDFHYYLQPDEYRLVNAVFCKQHLLCNFCAIRRAAVKLRFYLERFRYLLAQRPFLTPHLVTLTVKNGPDLLERLNHLRTCYQRLLQRRKNYRGNNGPYTEFSKLTGGVGHYEITYNAETQEFHPHLHLIGLVNGRLHQLGTVAEWRAITKDSFILDVRPFQDYGPGFSAAHNDRAAVHAFREVFKYTLKFAQLPIALNYTIAEQLWGTRLLVSFGDFWGLKVPKALTDDPLEQAYVQYLYEWITDQYLLQGVQPGECE